MIDYDLLDEQYENAPTKQTIRPSSDPVGSLTDNRRKVKPNRDGAHKRTMAWQSEFNMIASRREYQRKRRTRSLDCRIERRDAMLGVAT